MKKNFCLLILFIVLPFSIFAQEVDFKQDWDKLVDYVNNKYVYAYIESLRNDQKENIAGYDKNIKPRIENVNWNSPLSYEKLSKILIKNQRESTNNELAKVINDKKKVDDSNKNLNNLLDISSLSNEYQKKLLSTQESLNKELSKLTLSEKGGYDGKSETSTISFRLKYLTKILPFVLILVIFILIVLLWLRTNRDRIIKTVLDSQRINIKFLDEDMKKSKSTNTSYGSNNMNLEKRINNLEIQLNSIISRLDSIEPYLKLLMKDDLNSQKNSTQENNQLPQTVSKIVKYLKTAKDGVFNNTYDTPAGCYYELFDINGNQAKFKFFGDSTEAIANKNAVFDNVCETSGNSTSAKKVISDESGILTLFSEGKWKVIQKAKIRFE